MRRLILNRASSTSGRFSRGGTESAVSRGTARSVAMWFTAASTWSSSRPFCTRASLNRSLTPSKRAWASWARPRASVTEECKPVEESSAAVACSSS